MAYKLYSKQFKKMLPTITANESNFLQAFGGRLEVLDGVRNNEVAMTIKVSDTDVTIQTYNTGPDVAFGSGTSNSNRFGPRREIKSTEMTVPYKDTISAHEGIDGFTVNDIADQVIAERMDLIGQEAAEEINGYLSEAISTNASATITGQLDEAGVVAAFDQASKTFTNNKIKKRLKRIAYVAPDVYNLLVNSGLATTGKNSTVSIDENGLYRFKGFDIIETPDEDFKLGENIYFVVENVGIVGVGIEVFRAIDSEDFHGTAIQFAGKYATYVSEPNKVGILKATLGN